MERHGWMIIGIVIMVAAVGVITILPSTDESASVRMIASDSVTGNVVVPQSIQRDCDACEGAPVCAAKLNKAYNYPNACSAECDGARILYDAICERIPHAAPSP